MLVMFTDLKKRRIGRSNGFHKSHSMRDKY